MNTTTTTELTIRLFATLKDKAGKSRISIPFGEAMRVDALLETIATHHPQVAEVLPISLVAVNRNFAERDLVVEVGDEVALFPPVSGG